MAKMPVSAAAELLNRGQERKAGLGFTVGTCALRTIYRGKEQRSWHESTRRQAAIIRQTRDGAALARSVAAFAWRPGRPYQNWRAIPLWV